MVEALGADGGTKKLSDEIPQTSSTTKINKPIYLILIVSPSLASLYNIYIYIYSIVASSRVLNRMLLRPLHHYRRCLVILVVIPLTWSFLLIGGTDNINNHKVTMSLSASAASANGDAASSNQQDDGNESSAQDCKEASAEESTNEGAVPLLEAPDPNESLPTFKLGETIRLEEMGPIIINTDGKHEAPALCVDIVSFVKRYSACYSRCTFLPYMFSKFSAPLTFVME